MEDVTLENFSNIYRIIMSGSGLESLLFRDFGLNVQSMLGVLYFLTAVMLGITFNIWHALKFQNHFADAMFQVAVMCHVLCFMIRLPTIFVYREEIATLISVNFKDFNSNQHRPNSSLIILKESYVYLKRLDKFMKSNFWIFLSMWYILPAIFSKSFVGYLNGSNGFGEVLRALPMTFPEEEETSIAMHMFGWLFHIILGLVFISIWVTLDVLCFGVTIFLKKQYQILRASLFYQYGETQDSPEPIELKPFVQDHVKLIRMTYMLRDILGPIVGAQMLQTIFVTACCTYMAAKPTAESGKQWIINFVAYSVFSLGELLAFCWLSHVTNTANEDLGFGIYQLSLNEPLGREKKQWVLPLLMSQKTIKYKAVGLMEINLETFLRVLQTSYSYYTLMQTQS